MSRNTTTSERYRLSRLHLDALYETDWLDVPYGGGEYTDDVIVGVRATGRSAPRFHLARVVGGGADVRFGADLSSEAHAALIREQDRTLAFVGGGV